MRIKSFLRICLLVFCISYLSQLFVTPLLGDDYAPLGQAVQLTDDPAAQSSTVISWSGQYYGVLWRDNRYSYWPVFYTLVGANGEKLMEEAMLSGDQQYVTERPSITWNEQDEVFAVVYQVGDPADLNFVTFDEQGNKSSPYRITNDGPDSASPAITWNGEVYGLAWFDYGGYIRFTCLSSSGVPLFSPVTISTQGDSRYPSIAWNSTNNEFGVAFNSPTGGSRNIFFVIVDVNGNVQHTTQVTATSGWSEWASLVFTGQEYAMAWQDDRYGNYEVLFSRFDTDGNILDPVPVRLTNTSEKSHSASLVWTGSEYGAIYNEYISDDISDIFFTRLDSNGNQLGGITTVTDTTGPDNSPKMCWNGMCYATVWYGRQTGNFDIYWNLIGDSSLKMVTVTLKDSSGQMLDNGTVQYYDNGWLDFGTINNGQVSKLLATGTYSFRMTYGGYTQQVNNVDVSINSTVEFQTVLANVSLKDHTGALMDSGSVLYYADGWKTFGETQDGEVSKELLPGTYSFRLTYEGYTQQQNNIALSSGDSQVDFQTVSATVSLKDHNGVLMDSGTVLYYAGGWKAFGSTQGGQVSKELLPGTYSFRLTYEGYTQQQNNIALSSGDSQVDFQTVSATVSLKDHNGVLMDSGTVLYYAGGWKTFGSTQGGQVNKELLPGTYSFRLTYEGYTQQKNSITLSGGNVIEFQTMAVTVKLSNSLGEPIDTGIAQYYASGWLSFGSTVDGQVIKDLLPGVYSFRMTYNGVTQQQNSIDISQTPIVEFISD